ncbi:uncharacterized protein FFB20_15903 [Fusarium fujikuroi]|nr:uncharacterized protein FFB20_15903 [Fusarium fujikuroi]
MPCAIRSAINSYGYN